MRLRLLHQAALVLFEGDVEWFVETGSMEEGQSSHVIPYDPEALERIAQQQQDGR